MTTWFVTRHAGAKEWATRQGLEVDRVVEHLELEKIGAGDKVLGSLPVNLVAELNEKGASYFHLTLPLPPELRGQEITADDMGRLGARLEEYTVKEGAKMSIAQFIDSFVISGLYDIGKFVVAYFVSRGFYEGVYKKWRYGKCNLVVMGGDKELVRRDVGPTLAEKIRDRNELSVYVKGVVSPYATFRVDIASEKAITLGLIQIDKSTRNITVDISKNPPKDVSASETVIRT